MRYRLVRHLAFGPDQLFAMVGDVERYPEFVPWVTSLRTWNRRDLGEGVVTLDAEAQVRFAIIKERFATRVTLDAGARVIDVALISGPFRRLKNQWCFEPGPKGCDLSFEIDFEFGSRLLHGLLAANFERAVGRLVGCFERRAGELYGPAPEASR